MNIAAISGLLTISFLPFGLFAGNFSVKLENRTVMIETAGQKYIAGAGTKASGWLDMEDIENRKTGKKNENTINTNLSDCDKKWTYFNSGNIEEIKIVKDDENEKVVYLRIKCSVWAKEKKNYDMYYLEVNLIARKDIPCLLVYQRIRNSTSKAQKLNFGSYTSGVLEWSSGSGINKVNPEKKQGHGIAKGNYILLVKQEDKDRNLGIISFTPTNFWILFAHRVFWGYNTPQIIQPGEYKEYKMAIMTAKNTQKIQTVYEKIKNLEFGDFITAP